MSDIKDLPVMSQIWFLFVKHKRLTDFEIEKLLPAVNPNSIRPARIQIERKGWIKRTDEKRVAEGRGEYTVFELVVRR